MPATPNLPRTTERHASVASGLAFRVASLRLIRRPAQRVVSLVSLVAALVAGPQEEVLARPIEEAPFDEVVATIDGEAILASDLRLLIRATEGQMSETEGTLMLLSKHALAKAARDANILIADRDLEREMEDRIRSLGGWERYRTFLHAAGSTPEKDRLLVRDGLRADQYVLHCIGLVPGSPHVRPALARGLDPGPKEIQDYYRDRRDQFQVPGATFLSFLTAKRSDFQDDTAARAALEAARSGPIDRAPLGDPRLTYERVELPSKAKEGLVPVVRAFVAGAHPGDKSGVLTLDQTLAIVSLLGEEPPRSLTFTEAQGRIQERLRMERIDQARRKLALELVRAANVWPEALRSSLPPEATPREPTVAPAPRSH